MTTAGPLSLGKSWTVLGIAGKQLVGERGRAAVTPEGERSILLQATRVSTLPKLTFDDVRRFDGLIHDIFPGVELSNFQYEELERAIKEVLQTRGCEVVPEQVEKMLQLHMALAQRMGVIIVGMLYGGVMTTAPLIPSLGCEKWAGGSGCGAGDDDGARLNVTHDGYC